RKLACISWLIILQHGRLTVWNDSALAQPSRRQGQAALLCGIINGTGTSVIKSPWNSDSFSWASDLHHLVSTIAGCSPPLRTALRNQRSIALSTSLLPVTSAIASPEIRRA